MAVLIGSFSTGKTKACWEAVQPLAEHGWRLRHLFDPTRAEAALADLRRVGPRTVVWLNEAQHYPGHQLGHHRPDDAVQALPACGTAARSAREQPGSTAVTTAPTPRPSHVCQPTADGQWWLRYVGTVPADQNPLSKTRNNRLVFRIITAVQMARIIHFNEGHLGDAEKVPPAV
ncbi:hypothetical protein AB0D04_37385 [Streptomyces sp. NPDC048483]|uniref:hypothetical protein n=1 Tax=Streptomyces sp. NPDC048483 TaxID=3154927 RepID=UPI003446BD26